MNPPLDPHQVYLAKVLILTMVRDVMNFPQAVVIQAFRELVIELEQAAINHSR